MSRVFRRAGILLAPLVAGWAVTHFAPGVWSSVTAASGRDDLSVTVLTPDQFDSPAEADHSGTSVVAHPLSAVPDPPPDDLARWWRAQGAVDADTTLVRLVVRGTSAEQVTIHQLEVDVVRRDLPLPGLHLTGDSGGTADPRYLHADLTSGEVTWNDGAGEPTGPLSLTVGAGEEELIDVLATAGDRDEPARSCDCRWLLRLSYTVGGGDPRSTVVGPRPGETFRTTSTTRAAVWNLSTSTCTDAPGVPPLCDVAPPPLPR